MFSTVAATRNVQPDRRPLPNEFIPHNNMLLSLAILGAHQILAVKKGSSSIHLSRNLCVNKWEHVMLHDVDS